MIFRVFVREGMFSVEEWKVTMCMFHADCAFWLDEMNIRDAFFLETLVGSGNHRPIFPSPVNSDLIVVICLTVIQYFLQIKSIVFVTYVSFGVSAKPTEPCLWPMHSNDFEDNFGVLRQLIKSLLFLFFCRHLCTENEV